jgi:hypothetical protein
MHLIKCHTKFALQIYKAECFSLFQYVTVFENTSHGLTRRNSSNDEYDDTDRRCDLLISIITTIITPNHIGSKPNVNIIG